MARKNCRNKSWVHRGYNSSSPGREDSACRRSKERWPKKAEIKVGSTEVTTLHLQDEKKKSKNIGVREARTLDLRITHFSYETYALANCATTPFGVLIES
jgi:hypothetical protein